MGRRQTRCAISLDLQIAVPEEKKTVQCCINWLGVLIGVGRLDQGDAPLPSAPPTILCLLGVDVTKCWSHYEAD